MPYAVTAGENPAGVLVGTVSGHLGVDIHFAVSDSLEEALCRKATGDACPV